MLAIINSPHFGNRALSLENEIYQGIRVWLVCMYSDLRDLIVSVELPLGIEVGPFLLAEMALVDEEFVWPKRPVNLVLT